MKNIVRISFIAFLRRKLKLTIPHFVGAEFQRYEGASTIYGPWTLAGNHFLFVFLFLSLPYHFQLKSNFSVVNEKFELFAAYQQEFAKVAAALAKNETLPPGPTPPDLRHCTV
jgi:hypothetical protein